MQELIRLREYYKAKLEKAESEHSLEMEKNWTSAKCQVLGERVLAFSRFIRQLDLILNNSVVKPSERRSPTDETFSGCKPPERKAKSTDDKDKCDHEIDLFLVYNKFKYNICNKCGKVI